MTIEGAILLLPLWFVEVECPVCPVYVLFPVEQYSCPVCPLYVQFAS